MASEYSTDGYTCQRCGRVTHNPNDLAMRYCGACHAFEEQLGLAPKKKPVKPQRGRRLGQSPIGVIWGEVQEMQDKLKDLERLEQIRRDRQYLIEEEP